MGISITDLKTIFESANKGYFDGMKNVLDMGAQEIHIKKNDFIKIAESYGYKVNLKDFPNIDKDNWPAQPRDSSSNLWKMLGFELAECSDVNTLHSPIFLNLNEPLNNKDLEGKYDLVTDVGNNEHPFNAGEAYRTMHRLCKKDGLLFIHQNIFGGNGFYNMDISFFECMAAVNNYEILTSYFILLFSIEVCL